MPNPLARVAKVKINGTINQKMAENIFKRLTLASFLPIRGVVVHINSIGGSLTQAKNISDMLRNFAKEKHAPLYCFAEDQCIGAANAILTTGHKCYANKMSVMGGFGFTWQTFNFHKLAEKYNIKQESITVNSNNMRYNQFEQLKPQSVEFTKMQLEFLSQDLIESTKANRAAQIEKLNISSQQLKEQIFDKPAVGPETMIKCGVIDEIRNAWQAYQQQFKGTRWFLVNRDQVYDMIRYGFSSQIDHSYLQNYQVLTQFYNDNRR